MLTSPPHHRSGPHERAASPALAVAGEAYADDLSPVERSARIRPRARGIPLALRSEIPLVRLALGVIALHIADDSYLQPAPGTSPGDHIASGLVPLAVLALIAVAYPQLRAGLRAGLATTLGLMGIAIGGPGAYYLARGDSSGEEYTGVLAIVAGIALVVAGPIVLWRSRRSDGTRRERWLRRSLGGVAAAVLAPLTVILLVFPVALGYVYTHGGRTAMTPEIGVPLERVTVTTSDSLELAAWYVPSRNRAAVMLYPGADRGKEARMLIRHGYGVLLLEPRGEGGSQGDVHHWAGDRDVLAAAAWLQARPDVDARRVGGLGFSIGGEVLLEAAAQTSAFEAVIADGAGERVGETDETGPIGPLTDAMQAMITATTTVFSNERPPPPLVDRVGLIAPRSAMFIHAEHGMGGENTRQPLYYAAAGQPKTIWRVPGATHTENISAQPAEYERRVIRFLDRALLGEGSA